MTRTRAGLLLMLLILSCSCAPGAGGGTEAVDFELPDINPASPTYGKDVRLSALWKERGLVVNFMASWCGPCRVELPALQAIHASGDASIVVVAADEGVGTEDLLTLVRSSGLTMPVLYAGGGRAEEVARAYTYEALPATYLIDAEGQIRQLLTGARPEEAFRQAINASLHGSAARRH